jgi:hypothetical protein
MYIPFFSRDNVEPALWTANAGDAFQAFLGEVLRAAGCSIATYPGGGRDGGIDLIETVAGRRVVFEAKYIGGSKAYEEAPKRWRSTAGHIRKHLSGHAEAPGQQQYAPWLRTDQPIVGYTFWISGRLSGQSQRDALRDEIAGFFDGLAQEPHLGHLRGLDVQVCDWDDA